MFAENVLNVLSIISLVVFQEANGPGVVFEAVEGLPGHVGASSEGSTGQAVEVLQRHLGHLAQSDRQSSDLEDGSSLDTHGWL